MNSKAECVEVALKFDSFFINSEDFSLVIIMVYTLRYKMPDNFKSHS